MVAFSPAVIGGESPPAWIVKFLMLKAFIVIRLFPFTGLAHVFTVPIAI